jgi:hypothetical protein
VRAFSFGALCKGWAGSPPLGKRVRDVGPLDRFGFAWRSPFRFENPAQTYLIILDFLGFSRPNRDFQWVTRNKPEKIFCRGFSLALAAMGHGPEVFGVSMRRIVHPESLA